MACSSTIRWRSWFDFGHREDGVIEIGGPDGPIDYYVIAGPTHAPTSCAATPT